MPTTKIHEYLGNLFQAFQIEMSETDKINVDSIISRLLEVRGSRPGKAVQLTEAEIRGLCLKVSISLYFKCRHFWTSQFYVEK